MKVSKFHWIDGEMGVFRVMSFLVFFFEIIVVSLAYSFDGPFLVLLFIFTLMTVAFGLMGWLYHSSDKESFNRAQKEKWEYLKKHKEVYE